MIVFGKVIDRARVDDTLTDIIGESELSNPRMSVSSILPSSDYDLVRLIR